MHILQVTPYFPPAYAYGGIPRIVHGLSQHLHKMGHRVSVLTTDACDAVSRVNRTIYGNEDGVHVWSVPNISNRLAYHQQLFLPLLDSEYFEQIEREVPVDIIHLHGHRHLLNNIVLRWAKQRDIPYVFTANGTLRRHERKILIKVVWDALLSGSIPRKADACIAVSKTDRSIHRKQGISDIKVHHIPNGLDLSEFHPIESSFFQTTFDVPAGHKCILYLGRISPRKGVDTLVQSFQHLQTRNAHLVIAGSDMGGLRDAKLLAKRHPHIHFSDTISGSNRLQALSAADLVVYPSKDEIFGLVPFEALMSGTPVLVSDDCGCGEIIREVDAGSITPYGDVHKLTEEIDALLSTPDRCRDMVTRGQQYIREHLSFDVIARRHSDLYHHLRAS